MRTLLGALGAYNAVVPNVAVILEDDANRIAAMQACVVDVLSGVEAVFFENAQLMIAWLREHLADAVLISLDHDLPLRNDEGCKIDCGTGRQVADYLALLPPTCPVIIHSSNNDGAQGMFFALKNAGWPCSRVYPCDGEAWIGGAWTENLRRLIADGWVSGANHQT